MCNRGDPNPPAFSAVPVKVVANNSKVDKRNVSKTDPSDWVWAYLDKDGKPRTDLFDRSIEVVSALAAVPGGFVAAGGDLLQECCVLKRYAGPEKGFEKVWESRDYGRIDRLDTTDHGILAWGGKSNTIQSDADFWLALVDAASGRCLWKHQLNQGGWEAVLYARAISRGRVLVGGSMVKRTVDPLEKVPDYDSNGKETLVDKVTIERQGLLRCYRLCDADALPITR